MSAATATGDIGRTNRRGAGGSVSAEAPVDENDQGARYRGGAHAGDAIADQRRAAAARQSALAVSLRPGVDPCLRLTSAVSGGGAQLGGVTPTG